MSGTMHADPRTVLESLIRAALRAADPAEAIHRHVRCEGESLLVDGATYDLRTWDEVRLIAVGKAAVPMAQAIAGLLGDRLSRAVVVTKYGHATSPAPHDAMTVIEAGHPVPDENSQRGGEAVCDALRDCTARTLVLVGVSGGASALLVAPHPGISLGTLRAVNDALLRSGADIREMNAVRSRLDRLKGGGLVRMARPAQVVGLILSDVIGDPLDVIASGLTNDPYAHNVLVGNNAQACGAVAEAAGRLGFAARVITTMLQGEARERGREIARAVFESADVSLVPCCSIYGGETTVTVRGKGKGGRNQELALAAAIEWDTLRSAGQLTGRGDYALAALGTDGTDGPTDAAGAFAFADTVQRARTMHLDAGDFLDRNDSYTFFNHLGDLIMTGPTGTNVADLIIVLRWGN
jgi:hydroxypyruvate reductase